MQQIIGASKYRPPQLPDIVHRLRLIDRLANNADKRVVLITGQAAQGKTTLAAAYMKSIGAVPAWVHLGPEDSDPVMFCDLIVHAFQHALSQPDLDRYLQKPQQITFGPLNLVRRCKERLRSLFAHVTAPPAIVLDGLDRLAPDADVWPLVDDLIASVSPAATIFLISREWPPLKLQRFKMNQTLLSITNPELAFTREEIRDFFLMRRNFAATPELIERIHRICDGWVGGLILLSEFIMRLSDGDALPPPSHFPPKSLMGESLQYFSEEIFSNLPEKTQTILVIAAIPEVIDSDLIVSLSGEADAATRLDELVRRNVFIERIQDENGRNLFRLNQLFREFLQNQFPARFAPADRNGLYAAAGRFYRRCRQAEVAIPLFLAAGDHSEAIRCIKKIGIDFSVRGRTGELAKWLDQIPEHRRKADPWLLFFRTLARRITGGRQNILDFKAAFEQFAAVSDIRGQMLSLSYLIEAGVFLGHDPGEVKRWITQGAALLETVSGSALYAFAKALLWLQIGFGRISGAGDIQKGLSACKNAYLLARRIGDSALQVNATIVSALGMASAGEFESADRLLEKIDAMVVRDANPEYRALQNIVQIDLELNKGDFTKAAAQMEEIRGDIETFGLLFLYPAFIEASGRLAVYTREYENAEKIRNHLSDVAVLAGSNYYKGLSFRLAGLIHYHRGHFDTARLFTEKAVRKLLEAAPANHHLHQATELLGLVLYHLGQPDRAEEALEKALEYFTKVRANLSVAETHFALALVKMAQKASPAAVGHLAAGFEISSEKQYRHFIILRPGDLLQACILCVESKIRPAADYATILMSTRLARLAGPKIEALSQDPRGKKIARNVRRAIIRANLPHLEIRTLGGFRVFRGKQDPVEEKEWGGSRPKLLLKSIVVHGSRDVPKDMLIEDLWSESSPKAASENFKVTLHRLRKVLEPNLDPSFGSSYIHLKDHLVSLDPELCHVDVEQFLQLHRRIRRLDENGDPHFILDMGRRSTGLYGGDFLPEEPYAPWIEMKRAALRESYLEILNKKAEIYESLGEIDNAIACYLQVVRCDPMAETVQQRLMQLYALQGKRSAALKVYEIFRSTIESDIGVSPDESTTALYRTLQRS